MTSQLLNFHERPGNVQCHNTCCLLRKYIWAIDCSTMTLRKIPSIRHL